MSQTWFTSQMSSRSSWGGGGGGEGGGGRPDTRERQKSNLGYPLSLKLLRLISLLCHHLKAINNILMPTL